LWGRSDRYRAGQARQDADGELLSRATRCKMYEDVERTACGKKSRATPGSLGAVAPGSARTRRRSAERQAFESWPTIAVGGRRAGDADARTCESAIREGEMDNGRRAMEGSVGVRDENHS